MWGNTIDTVERARYPSHLLRAESVDNDVLANHHRFLVEFEIDFCDGHRGPTDQYGRDLYSRSPGGDRYDYELDVYRTTTRKTVWVLSTKKEYDPSGMFGYCSAVHFDPGDVDGDEPLAARPIEWSAYAPLHGDGWHSVVMHTNVSVHRTVPIETRDDVEYQLYLTTPPEQVAEFRALLKADVDGNEGFYFNLGSIETDLTLLVFATIDAERKMVGFLSLDASRRVVEKFNVFKPYQGRQIGRTVVADIEALAYRDNYAPCILDAINTTFWENMEWSDIPSGFSRRCFEGPCAEHPQQDRPGGLLRTILSPAPRSYL